MTMGWRAWALTITDDGPVLCARSMFHRALASRAEWPGMPATATCAIDPAHEPPHPECSCGMYFCVERWPVETTAFHNRIVGRALVLGRITAHDPVLPPAGSEGVAGELRAHAVSLAGPQLLHPDAANHADALTARYQVPFEPAPELLRNPLAALADEWERTGLALLNQGAP